MSFQLKRREDRPATIEERRKLVEALKEAKTKLMCYRGHWGGEYIGGMEYTQLMRLIDEALQ